MKYFKNVKIIPSIRDKVLFTKIWICGKMFQRYVVGNKK